MELPKQFEHYNFDPHCETAIKNALALSLDHIGTHHLVLGILALGQDVVAPSLGITASEVETLKETVERFQNANPHPNKIKNGITFHAHNALVNAHMLSKRSGRGEISIVHVIQGILTAQPGIATQLLSRISLTDKNP